MRAVVLLFALMLLGWFAPARAQSVQPVCTAVKNPKCDQGQAYTDAARTASLGYCGVGKTPTGSNIVHDTVNMAYRGDYQCQGDTSWRSGYTSYYVGLCTARQQVTTGFTPPNGSTRCDDGCRVRYGYNGDGTSTATPGGGVCTNDEERNECGDLPGTYWHPNLNVCAPIDPPDCEPGQTPKEGVCKKPDQCSEGMHNDENNLCKPDDNECPAGKTKAPDGSCTSDDGECKAGEAKGEDGTCKPDADGDGEPDEEDEDPENDPDKKQFSGGDSCDTPPSCSGDAIMCGQARIQWRIECNTRRSVNIAGGSCDAVPVCTGEKCNAMEYAQLLQQWRTSCAVQKLAAGQGTGPGTGAGDGNGNGVPDVMEGGVTEGEGTAPSVGEVDGGSLWSQVDRAGWLGGGACPGLPTFEWKGRTVNLSDKPCEQGALLGQLIVLSGMLVGAFIIGRAAAGGG